MNTMSVRAKLAWTFSDAIFMISVIAAITINSRGDANVRFETDISSDTDRPKTSCLRCQAMHKNAALTDDMTTASELPRLPAQMFASSAKKKLLPPSPHRHGLSPTNKIVLTDKLNDLGAPRPASLHSLYLAASDDWKRA